MKEIHKAIIFFVLFILFSVGAVLFALSDIHLSRWVNAYMEARTDALIEDLATAEAMDELSPAESSESPGASSTAVSTPSVE